jgi:DNA-binding MarR family transcriptional regulator
MSSRPPSAATKIPYQTTLKVRDCCLCLHVQRAARALGRRFDDALRPFGLTNGQFSMMMSLNRPDPAGMTSVATLLAMDRTTLTAALKPLQRRGLVQVAPDPGDRRSRLLTLTPAGHRLLAKAVPVWEKNHAELERSLPGHDPDRLRHDLQALLRPPASNPPAIEPGARNNARPRTSALPTQNLRSNG